MAPRISIRIWSLAAPSSARRTVRQAAPSSEPKKNGRTGNRFPLDHVVHPRDDLLLQPRPAPARAPREQPTTRTRWGGAHSSTGLSPRLAHLASCRTRRAKVSAWPNISRAARVWAGPATGRGARGTARCRRLPRQGGTSGTAPCGRSACQGLGSSRRRCPPRKPAPKAAGIVRARRAGCGLLLWR